MDSNYFILLIYLRSLLYFRLNQFALLTKSSPVPIIPTFLPSSNSANLVYINNYDKGGDPFLQAQTALTGSVQEHHFPGPLSSSRGGEARPEADRGRKGRERKRGRKGGKGEAKPGRRKKSRSSQPRAAGASRKVTLSSSAQPMCPFSVRGQFAGNPAPAEGSYSQVMPLARGRDLLPPRGGEATLCN